MVQKAYVTSIGEATTELCVWSLERNGFDVVLLENNTTLAQKLQFIYEDATDSFLRVDADIILNRNMTPELLETLNRKVWWWQFLCFDWFKMDTNHALSYIRKEALPALRIGINNFLDDLRPETQMSRLPQFYNPRRMETYTDKIMGLHGYKEKDVQRVKDLKAKRNQMHLYDFELSEKVSEL